MTAGDGAAVKDYTLVVFAEDPRQVDDAGDPLGHRSAARSGRPGPDQDHAGGRPTTPSRSTTCRRASGTIPETLERLKARAQHFTLSDGEQKTLDLKIAAER